MRDVGYIRRAKSDRNAHYDKKDKYQNIIWSYPIVSTCAVLLHTQNDEIVTLKDAEAGCVIGLKAWIILVKCPHVSRVE